VIIGTPKELPGEQGANFHGGTGAYFVRTLLKNVPGSAFEYCRYIVLRPGSVIGDHPHLANEEIYFIISGHGVMQVDGEECRIEAGSAVLAKPGSHHGLRNDDTESMELFVVCATALKAQAEKPTH
jgi:mannose-6-phosphate isomerase-like protein (cupin superfamily)